MKRTRLPLVLAAVLVCRALGAAEPAFDPELAKKLGADEGKLAVAGPFEKNDKAWRGLYIFNVSTVEEAEKLVARTAPPR